MATAILADGTKLSQINISKATAPFRYVESVAFDELGRQWFATVNGLYYREGKTFVSLPTVLDGSESRFTDIAYDPLAKEVYTSSTNGISAIDSNTLTSRMIHYDKAKIQMELTKQLAIDGNGVLYIGSDKYLNIYSLINSENTAVNAFTGITDSTQWDQLEFHDLLYAQRSGLYMSTVHGILWLNDKTSKISLAYASSGSNESFSRLVQLEDYLYFFIESESSLKLASLQPGNNDVAILKEIGGLKDILYVAADEKRKTIWFCDLNTVYRYSIEDDLVEEVYRNTQDVEITSLAVYEDKVYITDELYDFTELEIEPNIMRVNEAQNNLSSFTESVYLNGIHYVGSNNGILAIGPDKTSILPGTEGNSIKSILIQPSTKNIVFSDDSTIYFYDLEQNRVIDHSENKTLTKLNQINNRENSIRQLTLGYDDLIYYVTYWDGLWVYDGREHSIHSSEKKHEHSRYNLNLRYAQETLFVVRQGNAVVTIDKNDNDRFNKILGLAIKKRHYREILEPEFEQENTPVLNERYHRNTFITNDEAWISFGNGSFSQLADNTSYARHYNTGVTNSTCIQHLKGDNYLLITRNGLYRWNKVTNISSLFASFRGYINPNLASTEICKIGDGRLLLGNSKNLLYVDIKALSSSSHNSQVIPARAAVLDSNLKTVEYLAPSFDQGFMFQIRNPEARYISIEFNHDNQFESPTISVENSSLEADKRLILPAAFGKSTYQWTSNFGLNSKSHHKIIVDSGYSSTQFIAYYKTYLISFIAISIIGWWLWSIYLRHYNLIKTRLSNVRHIALKTINKIENIQASTSDGVDNLILSNGYLKRPLLQLQSTVNTLSSSLDLLKVISNYNLEEESLGDSDSPESFTLFELAQSIYTSPKLQYSVLPRIKCDDQIVVNRSIAPLLYFIHQAVRDTDQTLNMVISRESSQVVIKLCYSQSSKELMLISKAMLKPYYKSKISKKTTILRLPILSDDSLVHVKSESRIEEFHQEISKKKNNVIVIGNTGEFDSNSKTYWLKNNLLSKIPGPRFMFTSSTDEFETIITTKAVSYVVYISLYESDFSLLKKLNHINRSHDLKICTVTNVNLFQNAYDCGASLVLDREASPVSIANLLSSPVSTSQVISLTESQSLKKLHTAIDNFIKKQLKLGPTKAAIFPRKFERFCEEQNVRFSKSEILEIEQAVEEKVSKYCIRYRVRKFKDRICEHTELKISSEKLIYGFGEKSRTFDMFKEEFGMTPDKYRQQLNRSKANIKVH
jgi:hypothetical protein